MISKQITSARWTKHGCDSLQSCCGRHICPECRLKGIRKQQVALPRFKDLLAKGDAGQDEISEVEGMILVQEKSLACPACSVPGVTKEQLAVKLLERLAKEHHPTALYMLGTF
jgi:hypothetical protein